MPDPVTAVTGGLSLISGSKQASAAKSAAQTQSQAALAGIEEQRAPKRYLRIRRRIAVRDGDKWACFQPYDGFKVGFTIDFNHPMFRSRGCQSEIDFGRT